MKVISVCKCFDAQTNYECGGLDKAHCEYAEDYCCAEVALCAGRHKIPQAKDGYIFENIPDPTNTLILQAQAQSALKEFHVRYVDLYVTGLTQALVATINAAKVEGISLTLYHYNKDTGEYFAQPVF